MHLRVAFPALSPNSKYTHQTALREGFSKHFVVSTNQKPEQEQTPRLGKSVLSPQLGLQRHKFKPRHNVTLTLTRANFFVRRTAFAQQRHHRRRLHLLSISALTLTLHPNPNPRHNRTCLKQAFTATRFTLMGVVSEGLLYIHPNIHNHLP